jgi:hypothetical protein
MTKRLPTTAPPAPKSAPAAPDKSPAPPAAPGRTGRVNFDERGHAVWEWAVRTGMFDRNASTQRVRALTETPVKLELEQTLGAPQRRGAQPSPGKAAPSFNPYEPVKQRPAPKEQPAGTDPYSRGPARRPEAVTFNPYERRPKHKG